MKRMIVVVALLLSACSSAPSESAVQTAIAQTAIAQPSTPLPTIGPRPSSTPTIEGATFEKWTVEQAIAAFKAANLEAENSYEMEPKDYGLAPLTATKGVRFIIPSLGKDAAGNDQGGRVFSFANTDDLKRTQTYYDELGKGSAVLFSWLFVKDNILVQLNGELSKEVAQKYGTALDSMK